MYRFYLNNVVNDYHYAEMCRVFLDDSEFETIGIVFGDNTDISLGPNSFILNKDGNGRRDTIKRELYNLLNKITGLEPEWGTMTGVRPLKLAFDIYNETGSYIELNNRLSDLYLMSNSKIYLLNELIEYQTRNVAKPDSNYSSLYIGIPFCPTRCAYCSFASNVATKDAIEEYYINLIKEIKYTGNLARNNGTKLESIYIGGGTPTTLSSSQLSGIIETTAEAFAINPAHIEFTVEAGRPDTITSDKLSALREHGISRISINPQTMKDSTLKLIGRNHCATDIVDAYKLAIQYGFDTINADLIAGLPDEYIDDFINTLDTVLMLGANNITIHTLSVKRGSRLKDDDPNYYRHRAEIVSDMLKYAHYTLINNGFSPYYMYKQKHQIGAFENVGYCKEGKHSLYNIRIMEEKQTIIALGAGGIGKVYYPNEDRLERIANVSNYQVYNERFEEMLNRKNLYYGG